MRNPWTKRNPAMSIMLSAANAWMGAASGIMQSAIKRQLAARTKTASPAKKKRRRRPSR
jgi:hypothetical protein